MAGGHFSCIEYRSHGSLPGSLISEFAHIARDYVNDAHQRHENGNAQTQTPLEDIHSSPLQQRGAQAQVLPGASEGRAGANMPSVSGSDLDNIVPAEMPDFNMTFNGFPDYMPSNAMLGTDVMGIFNYYLPEMDPMFYQGLNEEYDFGQGLSGSLSVGDSTVTSHTRGAGS
ncbi:hypothetical protein ACHAQH_007313 [Verticillium albo-atrum]